MAPEEIAQHLCDSFDAFEERAIRREAHNDWNGLRNDLLVWIFSVPVNEAFEGLFLVLETQSRFQYQWLAGDLLLRARIPCPLPLRDFVTRLTSRFNASADTVPKYIGHTFGKASAVATLQELRMSVTDAVRLATIDNMMYGLGEYPGGLK